MQYYFQFTVRLNTTHLLSGKNKRIMVLMLDVSVHMNHFKKYLLILFFLLGFFLLSPSALYAANYFVSPSGNDTASGFQTTPWKTIQKAAAMVNAGDTVTVLAGEYPERITISRSGSSENRILFQTLGTVYTKGFNVLANYITVDGFHATSNNTNWRDGWGIFVNGNYVHILNNFVYYSNGGIDIFHPPTQTTPTDSNIVKGNKLFRNRNRNLELEGTNTLIEANEIWAAQNSAVDPPGSITGSLGDSDGIHFHGSGHIIRLNYIHDMTYNDPQMSTGHMDCMQTWQDPYHEAASNILIEQNTCELETYNSCCIAHSFMLSNGNNITIRNNLLKTIGGINQGYDGPNSSVHIYNNTFVSKLNVVSEMYNVGVTSNGSSYYTIKNNIFYNFQDHAIFYDGTTDGHAYSHNITYNSSGSTSTNWCMGSCRVVDPKFISSTSNFHLQSSSPAIDTGITLPDVTNDFDNISRPKGSGYDIGAFEYNSGSPQPIPTATLLPTKTPIPSPTPTPSFSCPPAGTTGSGTAAFTFSIAQPGNYKVWINMMGQGDLANTIWLQFDNLYCSRIGDLNGMPINTFTWVDYENGTIQDKIPMPLLAAGNHTITLIGNAQEPGVSVDKILITMDTSCIPQGTGDTCIGIFNTPTPLPTFATTPIPTIIPTVLPSATPTPNVTDTIPPALTITSPQNGTVISKNQNLKISATTSDTSGIASIKLYLDSSLLKSCTNTTTCTINTKASSLKYGSHTVTVIAQDKARPGNMTTKTVYFTK